MNSNISALLKSHFREGQVLIVNSAFWISESYYNSSYEVCQALKPHFENLFFGGDLCDFSREH
jgi:hypothetical protein